jgi:spermidine/putrescine-binding protein
MKKLLVVFTIVVLALSLTGCQEETTLYVLNWGDYINQDVVDSFSEEFGVNVVVEEVDSNEAMYEKIKSGNTNYDIAIPSDYMIERLMEESLVQELDKSKLPNFKDDMFEPAVYGLMSEAGINNYAVPYFYGSVGLMYRNDMESYVKEHGFGVLFNEEATPEETRIGMYNSSRDSVASALLYLDYDVNTMDEQKLLEAEELLSNMEYQVWGDDNLKTEIVAGNLDIALVYSGDYFDSFYIALEEEGDIEFSYMTPKHTNIWVDAMVVPNLSQNVDLAYEFVNYFINPDNALTNVEYVGYTPVITEVYESMVADSEWSDITENIYFRDIYYQDGFVGQMYKHTNLEHYQVLEEIMMRAKAE